MHRISFSLAFLCCILFIPLLCLVNPSFSQPISPIATFSIVGYDPGTGDLGVAVQSKAFAVGTVVPWAEAEVGAIATQAFANPTYGSEGLKLLKDGLSVEQILERLLAADPEREVRQVGIVDAAGNVANHTGNDCLEWAGAVSGENYTAQGNSLAGEAVVEAMGKAFAETEGELADKLMAALFAGQEQGGDVRGQQSAALLVVRKDWGYGGYGDRFIDLRVDDAEEPIEELNRLLEIHKGFYSEDDSSFETAVELLDGQGLPQDFALLPPYPNPTNSSLSIPFQLAAPGNIRLELFNLAGQHLETLLAGMMPAGHHRLRWDSGRRSSGVYVVRLTAGAQTQAHKLLLLR